MAAGDGKLVRNWTGGRHFLENALPDRRWDQRLERLWMVVGGPKAGGTSRQRHPVFNTCRMPEMTIRAFLDFAAPAIPPRRATRAFRHYWQYVDGSKQQEISPLARIDQRPPFHHRQDRRDS